MSAARPWWVVVVSPQPWEFNAVWKMQAADRVTAMRWALEHCRVYAEAGFPVSVHQVDPGDNFGPAIDQLIAELSEKDGLREFKKENAGVI